MCCKQAALLTPGWSETEDISTSFDEKIWHGTKAEWQKVHGGKFGDRVSEVKFGLLQYCMSMPIPNFNGDTYDVCFPYSKAITNCETVRFNASAAVATSATTTTTAATTTASTAANASTAAGDTTTTTAAGGAKQTLKVASFTKYVSYPGTLGDGISGAAYFEQAADGSLKVRYNLVLNEASATGGLHIHTGTDCAEEAGAHWWNAGKLDPAVDPWTTANGATYTTDAANKAVGEFTLDSGYTYTDNIGHTVVLHAASGDKIACGTLVNSPAATTASFSSSTVATTDLVATTTLTTLATVTTMTAASTAAPASTNASNVPGTTTTIAAAANASTASNEPGTTTTAAAATTAATNASTVGPTPDPNATTTTTTTTMTSVTTTTMRRQRRAADGTTDTGIYSETMCTTATGCDRFTGVCGASTIVQATLGVAILVLIIGAVYSEHTKVFGAALVIAGILGIVAMSAWVNWQINEGDTFSASSVQLGTGGWLIVGGWLLCLVGAIFCCLDCKYGGTEHARQDLFNDINWKHRLASFLSVLVWIIFLLSECSEQWSQTDSLGTVGGYCVKGSAAGGICDNRVAKFGIWLYCVEEHVDYFGNGTKADICIAWDRKVTVTHSDDTSLMPVPTTVPGRLWQRRDENLTSTSMPTPATTANNVSSSTIATATTTITSGVNVTESPSRYDLDGYERFKFADAENRILITKAAITLAVLFAIIADVFSDRAVVGTGLCALSGLGGLTAMSAWITFHIKIDGEGAEMGVSLGSGLAIGGWLLSMAATMLFCYRAKTDKSAGESSYQLESLNG